MYVRELYFSQCNSGLGNIIINSLPLKSSSKLSSIQTGLNHKQERQICFTPVFTFFLFLHSWVSTLHIALGSYRHNYVLGEDDLYLIWAAVLFLGGPKKTPPKHNNTRADIYSSHKTPAEFTVVNFSYRTPIDFCLGEEKKKFNYKILKAVSICAVITYCMYKGASNRISARENIFFPCVIEH